MSEPIQPWSRDKLDLLEKYLRAYTTIMRRQSWLQRCSFVDSFAGAGQFLDPATQDYVDGSPLVALSCDPPFDDFWFIDLSPTKITGLQELASAHGNRPINFRNGDANPILVDEVATTIRYERRYRGFVFLDPYGLQVRWTTTEALAGTRALDVFINFPIMAINRLLPRDARPEAWARARLEVILRDTAWIESLYVEQNTLFGEPVSLRGPLDAERVAEHYIGDLKQLFPHVSRAVIMRNTNSAPLYALLLASHNRTAVRITNDTFNRYDRL